MRGHTHLTSLPPRLHYWALCLTDHMEVPLPHFLVDGFPYCKGKDKGTELKDHAKDTASQGLLAEPPPNSTVSQLSALMCSCSWHLWEEAQPDAQGFAAPAHATSSYLSQAL